MVHGGTELDRSSPESSPSGGTWHQSSLQRRVKGEGDGMEITMAKIGRRGGEVAPTAERNGTRRRCSVLGGSGHG
jgi:hypothetical protein